MKKTMTTAMIAMFSILCACAIDADDESIDDDTSEASSEVTGTLTCTTGYGSGTCTASSMPTGWTIQAGGTSIFPNGLTAQWFCIGSIQTRLVTAVGVGTATVKCARR